MNKCACQEVTSCESQNIARYLLSPLTDKELGLLSYFCVAGLKGLFYCSIDDLLYLLLLSFHYIFTGHKRDKPLNRCIKIVMA